MTQNKTYEEWYLEGLTAEQRELRPIAQKLYHKIDELCIKNGLRHPWCQLLGDATIFWISHPTTNNKNEHSSVYVAFSGLEIKKTPDIDELLLNKFETAKTQIYNLLSDRGK